MLLKLLLETVHLIVWIIDEGFVQVENKRVFVALFSGRKEGLLDDRIKVLVDFENPLQLKKVDLDNSLWVKGDVQVLKAFVKNSYSVLFLIKGILYKEIRLGKFLFDSVDILKEVFQLENLFNGLLYWVHHFL